MEGRYGAAVPAQGEPVGGEQGPQVHGTIDAGQRGRDVGGPDVAIVHDYLTQQGGAERVVLAMATAFPGAPIHTSVLDLDSTFAEFADLDVRPMPINRIGPIRRDHRLGLLAYAPSFAATRIDADVVVCSSSGWAHGVRTDAPKVVYCHTPARWLYVGGEHLRQRWGADAALSAAAPILKRWDRRAARRVFRYVANSTAIAERIWLAYGIHAEVLHPPTTLDLSGPLEPIPGAGEGFVLHVGRLLRYKHADVVVDAFSRRPDDRLVLIGSGPEEAALRAMAGPNVTVAGRVSDAQVRWAYANARAVVAIGHEDFGLVPVEAAQAGLPVVALRGGGFLDTVVDGTTGVFVGTPTAEAVDVGLSELDGTAWDEAAIRAHGASFGLEAFTRSLHELAAEAAASAIG